MAATFKGLLDVNVLVAHVVVEHEHHRRVVQWHRKLPAKSRLYSCPIVELGLVRNIMRIAGFSVSEARTLLFYERENLGLELVPDTLGADVLPEWVQGYRQTTDAYLQQLAAAHGLRFITLDKRLPEAIRIAE